VFRSPLTDFTRAAQARGLAGRVRLLARGEALMPLEPPPVNGHWRREGPARLDGDRPDLARL